jgi:hypothetical protein
MIAVGFILGKKYDDFRFVEHSKYSLPIVKQGGVIYSGFNMGAGENALFEIFSTLYSAGAGSLLVIDEMELGLHAEAQRKLVDRLKDVCLEERIQVICTTHSKEILDSLPLDARFYIESVNGKTRTTPGISSDFAFAKLSSITNQEADLLVEDEVAKAILLAALPAAIRTRIRIAVVGSAGALARQLAASYMRKDPKPVMAVFDGDQLTRAADNLSHAKKMAENATADFEPWFSNRVGYLPGEAWPEAWLLKKAEEIPSTLADVLNTDKDTLLEAIEYGKQAGKHKEFREIAHQLGLDTQNCLQLFVNSIISEFNDELSVIEIRLEQILNGDV